MAQFYGPDGHQLPYKAARPHFEGSIQTFLRTNEVAQVDSFFVSDLFTVRTNGRHTLVLSLNVAPDILKRNPTWFLLPPVTNSFDVLPIIDPRINDGYFL